MAVIVQEPWQGTVTDRCGAALDLIYSTGGIPYFAEEYIVATHKLLAVSDSGYVFGALFYRIIDGVTYVEYVVVDPQYLNSGYGALLYRALADYCAGPIVVNSYSDAHHNNSIIEKLGYSAYRRYDRSDYPGLESVFYYLKGRSL